MQLFSFLKKEFVKNVLTLLTGSAFSQVVIYSSILIITRIFSTEIFGIYMLFSSATLIIKPLSTLQYEFALVLPKEREDALNLLSFSFFILLLFSFLSLIIILLFKDSILIFFNISDLKNFIYLLPLSIFLTGCISLFDYWNNRINCFKNISNGQIVKAVGMSSSQIATGFSKYNTSFGLIPGLLLGLFFQTLFLIKTSYKSLQGFRKEISYKRMVLLAKKYKDIPIFNSIINVTNNLSNELPVFLITKYFGLSAAGVFGLAIKFTKAPVGIIQNSVNQVFFNRASKVYNDKGNLSKLILKTSKNLLLISCGVFIPLFILSFYIDFFFGENWTDVGLYARILIPWLFFALLSNPLTSLILVLNKQKTILIFDVITLCLRFLAFYIGFHFFDSIFISLVLFSGVGICFNIFLFLFLLKASNETKIAYQ
ncbi:lipopolysaccharide biosynthesis protein [Polaribacter septentrionalilitoris]|uniref:lipopolysaccharide biosynthesis protein n=1 Tax=Polaribacter septentrionalilitoris TaxID=2494657 RepID=UPI0013572618|nr:oligosaccharide flippase family protein [Polaribacter septentrionalilitoris]